MKFAMITTFFGPHSFGGDAAFVDRLSRALARHGHEVHVIYCRDAFEMVRGDQTPRPYEPPPGVTIHALSSRVGPLSPLATHQTGQPAFKANAIRSLLKSIRPDVVHFHNLSLIGGPGLLSIPTPGAVKLMTAHEHWLVCPLHVLWKFGEGVCEAPSCVRCSVQAGRPPQLWRGSDLLERSLRHLDALIAPSQSTLREHARRGIKVPMTHLPYFLPADYTGLPAAPTPIHDRPYVAVAGRLEKIKGFQDVIEAARRLPHIDLRIAGSGPFEADLRGQAEGLPNVHFEGRLDSAEVAALFRGALAVAVPSLVYETFGYVVLEAFAEKTPVIVRDLGALPELVAESGGGLVFRTNDELVEALDRLAGDADLRIKLGCDGYLARLGIWSEVEHLHRYLGLIEQERRGRRVRIDQAHRSGPRGHRSTGSVRGPHPALERGREAGAES
ncbi:glycosyltransferase family 4 protein [Tundrisphaera lichenicola]|uniref:glycosyltransferase family 4 protein n=1 Tax=Tundrisphaera lichenicola TaxID=2029860 RepID=UPI003EBE9690